LTLAHTKLASADTEVAMAKLSTEGEITQAKLTVDSRGSVPGVDVPETQLLVDQASGELVTLAEGPLPVLEEGLVEAHVGLCDVVE
jgi:hypothetical protein